LVIKVTEGGELESSKTFDVRCEVEGRQTKLVEMLPEGTRVTRGQVVARLDPGEIQRSFAEQEIKAKQADAKAKASIEDFEISKNKAASLVAQAGLALKLARLDRAKFVKGDYKVQVDELKGLIALAEGELEDAQTTLEYFRKLVQKGFRTPQQLRAKEQAVERSRYNLERDQGKLMVLENFTQHRTQVELTAKAEEAVRELERMKRSTKAEIAKAKTDMETAGVTAKLERSQLNKLRKQLDHCVLKAPQDGIVSYASDSSNRVQLGALVHFQQKLFSLPDLRHLHVKTYVHESVVKKIRTTLPAEIRVEAYPNTVLHGEVEEVATFFDSTRYWTQGGIKEYVTYVSIKDLPDAGLKPGMTAEVQILIYELPDVLQVPLQAIIEEDGEHFCYVIGPEGLERRVVKVGQNNDSFIEIQEGLEEDEQVVLAPRSVDLSSHVSS
jgi:RND family efflux transporter MFP subunit